jgi:hypothetical protein
LYLQDPLAAGHAQSCAASDHPIEQDERVSHRTE